MSLWVHHTVCRLNTSILWFRNIRSLLYFQIASKIWTNSIFLFARKLSGEYCKYSMGQKNGLHAFSITPPKVNRFRWNLGTLWAKCWELALADFGRDPCNSDSLRGSRNFIVFCAVNNARFHRFPVGQVLRHLKPTTSIGEAVKIFGTEFWKCYHKGSFFQKNAKNCSKKFPGLATSGRHNSAMITNAENLRLNGHPTGCLVSTYTTHIVILVHSWLWHLYTSTAVLMSALSHLSIITPVAYSLLNSAIQTIYILAYFKPCELMPNHAKYGHMCIYSVVHVIHTFLFG